MTKKQKAKEPLSRIVMSITVSVEVDPGWRIMVAEFEKDLPKLRLTEHEMASLQKYVPAIDGALASLRNEVRS